ncbi:MAG TPA: BlaI/MecI/CopY family transcriptional regulator [Chthonomonadaceae bacterium]|nr:BlaI/MecI/CopY family transcriptional regulator [Chthonomonadaceae bacterium]
MRPDEPLPPLSEAQTEIMNVIWEQGEVTLAQICTALTAHRVLARNTVQTQLTRLVEKGWLVHRSEGKAFYYRATVPREDARARVVQRLVDVIFGGSAEGLVMTLLDGRKLSREEADRIRALIERAEEGKP